MFSLSEKVALVTGASSGIGRAAARLFAGRGARLVLAGRRREALDDLQQEIQVAGGTAIALAGDVRSEQYAADLVALAEESFGGLDIAFNNAGILGDLVSAAEIPESLWQDVIATNLTAGFFGAKYQIAAMKRRGGGAIAFNASFVGNTVSPAGYAAYAASKAGLVGLAKVLAVECGPANIRVNALLPGGTETPMNAAALSSGDPGVREFLNGAHALNRLALPEEIAAAALFLVSDAASFVTGAAFLADGGVSVKMG
jgi:NAD(P)-dependent dehydrogenase (short-subunit alcohol dehydrogenase family)